MDTRFIRNLLKILELNIRSIVSTGLGGSMLFAVRASARFSVGSVGQNRSNTVAIQLVADSLQRCAIPNSSWHAGAFASMLSNMGIRWKTFSRG
jgi:hypothetical protein